MQFIRLYLPGKHSYPARRGYDCGVTRTSYLRVYLPLSSFSDADRERWLPGSGVDEPAGTTLRGWLRSASLATAGEGAVTEGCLVKKVGDQVLACPYRTRLRMLAGLLAFRSSVPEEVADAFVPRVEAERAARELAALGEDEPSIRSHILHANWHVPLRWFAAFEPEDRVLIEDAGGLRLRYEANLEKAQYRLARAEEILDEAPIDQGVGEAVKELSAWLSEFPSQGLLELDYAGVASCIEDEVLVEDHSATEVWTCLNALSEGDYGRAAEIFEDLSERWTSVRAHEVVN